MTPAHRALVEQAEADAPCNTPRADYDRRTREPLLAAAVRELSEQVERLQEEQHMHEAYRRGVLAAGAETERQLAAARRAGLEACERAESLTFVLENGLCSGCRSTIDVDDLETIDTLRSVLEGNS